MRSRTAILVVVALVVVLTVAGALLLGIGAGPSDDGEPRGIELGGMRMSATELDELARETMGARLDDVPVLEAHPTSRDLRGEREGQVRVFRLTARPGRWEYRDGQRVAVWAYEGMVPGPTLRAREGEPIRVDFTNELPAATTLHWHGVDVPWTQDGVPGVTQQSIAPGKTFSYEFEARPAGTRWYHTHGGEPGNEASQLDMGLSGALVIEPRRPVVADVDQVLLLDDWQVGSGGYNAAMMTGAGHGDHDAAYNVFTINGKAAPDVPDVVVKRGQRVRLRFVNGSTMSFHPMHLHGHQFRVVALDGNPVPAPVSRNVLNLAPGETADVEFIANNPGVWMLHCHELHHADAGMHLLVRYEGFELVGDASDDRDDGH